MRVDAKCQEHSISTVKWSLTVGLIKITKAIIKLLALKAVAVAYERWSLTGGSKYSDLTWKLLVVWKNGR